MRSLVEARILWLATAVVLAYALPPEWLVLVYAEWALLVVIAWPPQPIVAFGYAVMLGFAALLGGIDYAFGSLDQVGMLRWVFVGISYIVLYEFTPLYEIGQTIRDYGAPKPAIAAVNFGVRFVPVVFDGIRDAMIGYRSKYASPRSARKLVAAIAAPVIVSVLHKFEQMWISYNLSGSDHRRWRIRVDKKDWLFLGLSFGNVLAVVLMVSISHPGEFR